MIVEESVFRVYDRLLWGCAQAHARREARRAEQASQHRGVCAAVGDKVTVECSCLFVLFSLAVVTFASLLSLHGTYVGTGGCLASALSLIAANATGDISYLSPASRLSAYFNDSDVIRVYVYPAAAAADPLCLTAPALLPGSSVTGSDNLGLSVNPNFTAEYILSGRWEGVTTPQSMRAAHAFRVFNVCMPTSCALHADGALQLPRDVHTPFDNLLTWLFVSFDNVVVNAAMYAMCDRDGVVVSATTGESWDWTAVCGWETAMTRPTQRGYGISFLARIGMLLQGLLCFAFASSVSALLVRVLIESGAAALYPCLSMLRLCCCAPASLLDMSRRDVNNAYPWIGMNVAYLRQAGASTVPLISAHLLWIIFTVIIFSSSSSAVVGGAVYGWKSFPAGLSFGVMSLFALQEYFAYVFVRTRESIIIFARGCIVLFMAFHMYAVAYVYPFTDLAVALWALALLLLMFIVIVFCELPVYMRGDLSLARPRHASVWLAGPALPHQAPPIWSIFHVVNAALVGSYDVEVPALQAAPGPVAQAVAQAAGADPPAPALLNGGDAQQAGAEGDAVAVLIANDAPAASERGLAHRPLLSAAEFHSARAE